MQAICNTTLTMRITFMQRGARLDYLVTNAGHLNKEPRFSISRESWKKWLESLEGGSQAVLRIKANQNGTFTEDWFSEAEICNMLAAYGTPAIAKEYATHLNVKWVQVGQLWDYWAMWKDLLESKAENCVEGMQGAWQMHHQPFEGDLIKIQITRHLAGHGTITENLEAPFTYGRKEETNGTGSTNPGGAVRDNGEPITEDVPW